ncbi:KAP family NTPase [Saccharothrix sp. S26]|uniref:P-loop NTPase fold protein n=1 Tax=Saccharothrix sp. S26 TaxID=2907215 RepID=UPI001F3FC3DF|nr:P-loop NTPase fold protein [Saccharothrix sp. S26]MCE6994627.1 KAP family NTPase [Saccharothrix sp. S26]
MSTPSAALPDPAASRAVLIAARYRLQRGQPKIAAGARELALLLRDGRLWGLPAANCTLLEDPGTAAEVVRAIESAAAAVGDAGRLLVYFTGHGYRDDHGVLYLGMRDTDPGDLRSSALRFDSTGLPMSDDDIVILDCSYAVPARRPATRSGGTILGATGHDRRVATFTDGSPDTAFTDALLDVLRRGVVGGGRFLDIGTIHLAIREKLANRPVPSPSLHVGSDRGVRPVVRNLAATRPDPTSDDAFRRFDELDPFELGVRHGSPGEVLSQYMPRESDKRLRDLFERSRAAVVVGDSGTGKTRAAWEAIHVRRPDWRLWRPGSLSELLDRGGKSMPARTVVWLDDLDRFLGDLGDATVLARALADLVSGVGSEEVMVVATADTTTWHRVLEAAPPATKELLREVGVLRLGPFPAGVEAGTGPLVDWQVEIRGYGDRPPVTDLLRRHAVIGALADLIAPSAPMGDHDRSGPTVIALDGPWGIGKTSLVDLVGQELDRTPRPAIPADPVRRLRAREADRALSGRRGALWEPTHMARADPEQDPPLIKAHFEPWAHQTSEQVWAGLTTTILDAVEKTLLPRPEPATERYWFQRNLDRVDRMRVRRALRKGVLSPLLAVAVLALAVPIVAQLARSADTYRLAWMDIAGSNIAVLIAVSVFLAAVGHSAWRYLTRPAADFLPADLFVGPVPSGTSDEALRDPYHNARSGYLYLAQHDVFAVLEDVRASGHHMVVFVDDLDRCTPSATAVVFEAVNLFVTRTFPVTRFVLCLDTSAVAAHLDEVYPKLKKTALHGDDPSSGWSFLRKLIQLPVPLPPVTADRVPDLLVGLLGEPRGPDLPRGDFRADPTTAEVDQAPPIREEAPSREPEPMPTPEVDAAVGNIEHDEGVLERMSERLREQPSLSVREAKRMLTIWQYYIRVLIRLGHREGLAARARHLVVLAEIIARWPASQRALGRRTAGRHGLQLLAEAAHDDWAWLRALRHLDLHGAEHRDCAAGVRDLLLRYDGGQVADLAAELT